MAGDSIVRFDGHISGDLADWLDEQVEVQGEEMGALIWSLIVEGAKHKAFLEDVGDCVEVFRVEHQ